MGPLQFLLLAYGAVGVLVLWGLRLLVYLVWGRRRQGQVGWRRWVLEPALVCLVGFVVLSGAAFYARFVASSPFLAHHVREVQAGHVPPHEAGPVTVVGLFVVREVELLPDGVVRLITTRCGFDDCGIVYSPGGEPPEDSYTSLGAGWWNWWRSW